jgi:hypothetical protein
MLRRVLWQKITDVSEAFSASIIGAMIIIIVIIALMMEVANTTETSANYQTTRRNIPEDSHLHTRRRENLSFFLYMS